MCINLYLVSLGFIEASIISIDFIKILKYQISWESVHWDERTDLTKLIDFHNFVNTLKQGELIMLAGDGVGLHSAGVCLECCQQLVKCKFFSYLI
jgi:hypothetical protein